MTYRRFKRTPRFRKSFEKLPVSQQLKAKEKFLIFKQDPFAPSLRTHPIKVLSARAGHVVYSATVEADLRVIFVIDHGNVISLDIGTHDIYR